MPYHVLGDKECIMATVRPGASASMIPSLFTFRKPQCGPLPSQPPLQELLYLFQANNTTFFFFSDINKTQNELFICMT